MDMKPITLRLSVDLIGHGVQAFGNLRVSEDIDIGPKDFGEACRIIGLFHDLAERVRKGA